MNDEIDFERLKEYLIDYYGAQIYTFAGAFAYAQLLEVKKASDEDVFQMAEREGIDIDIFRK